MSLLKRFELWVLLILIGGGLFYVFNIDDSDDDYGRAPITATDPDIPDKPEPLPRFSLQKTTITRDGNHFLAEIEIRCRNDHKQALELNSSGTRLWAAGGNEVHPFFLPFQAPVKIQSLEETDITLRFWLSHDDINGPIFMQINDDTIPVKIGGFKANILPDKHSRSFTGTDWSSKA